MSSFDLYVNGKNYAFEADGQMPLLWVLRDLLGLTGTKFSCGDGLCGSCTVLINGASPRSCILPVERAAGKNILPIEGLSADGSHPLQKAWIEERVTQCGYCQAGQIMTAAALLASFLWVISIPVLREVVNDSGELTAAFFLSLGLLFFS